MSITFGPLTPLSNQAIHFCKQLAAGLYLIGKPIRIIGLWHLQEGLSASSGGKATALPSRFFFSSENPSLDGISRST